MRTLTGHGSSISDSWNGKDTLQNVLSDGVYFYTIQLSDPAKGSVGPPSNGTIQIDNTPPTVRVTSPREGAVLFGDDIPILGTAHDLNFISYQLAFGQGENPAQWTPFTSNSTSVEEALLGKWQTTPLNNGPYVLRLLVTDRADNTSQITVPVIVDNLKITEVATVPRFFNPTTESTQIRFTLDREAAVILKVYPFTQVRESQPANRIINVTKGNPVRTMSLGALSAGLQTVPWGGRDNAGNVLPRETYGIRLEATGLDGRQGTYDPAYIWGEVTRQNPSTSSSFDPFRNIPLLITYTIPVDAWITLKAGKVGEFVERARILWGLARPAGTHTERWDGRGDDGTVLTRNEFDQISLDAILLPGNAVVIQDPTLDISTFSVDGFVLFPAYRQVATIALETTRDAELTVQIFDPTGQRIRTLLDRSTRTAGIHTLEWDGRDDAGRPMGREGQYRIAATASQGQATVSRQGIITVFK